jgi:hypothetical protein
MAGARTLSAIATVPTTHVHRATAPAYCPNAATSVGVGASPDRCGAARKSMQGPRYAVALRLALGQPWVHHRVARYCCA